MTPAKRRPAKPASQKSTSAETNDGAQLLGPEGDPIAEDAPAEDAGANPAPPTDTGRAAPEDGATAQSPRRPLSLYPLPVWPD